MVSSSIVVADGVSSSVATIATPPAMASESSLPVYHNKIAQQQEPILPVLIPVASTDTPDARPYVSLHRNVPEDITSFLIPMNENVQNRIIVATKLLGDVVVAVTVTAMAAPFLAVIDKALVERTTAAAATAASSATSTQNNRVTVWTSMYQSSITILHQPMKFLRSPTFLWMWGTYAATYTAANTLRTLLAVEKTPQRAPTKTSITTNSTNHASPTRRDNKQSRTNRYGNYFPSSGTTLLIGTSIVNSTASVLKDRAYAQLYGATKVTTNVSASKSSSKLMVPNITYGLWLLRDLTVIGAAFVLPSHVAQFWIQRQHTNSSTTTKSHFPQFSDATILRFAQIGTPVVAQVIAGPLHFIGYDCYNHHNVQASSLQSNMYRGGSNLSRQEFSLSSYQFWSDRLQNLRSSVGQVIAARMMRIIPGYGIAGICNTEMLLRWKHHVVQPLVDNDEFWYRTTGSNTTKIEQHCTNVNAGAAVWNQHSQQRC